MGEIKSSYLKILVLIDVDTKKYYTGRFWDGSDACWTREVTEAKDFESKENLEKIFLEPEDEYSHEWNEWASVSDKSALEALTIYLKTN